MDEIKKILVALDLSEMDKTLISYTNFLIGILPVEEIIFINVIKNLSIPSEVLREFPNLKKDAINGRKQELREVIKEHGNFKKGIKKKIVVAQSHISKSLLESAEKYSIDLILVGRKVTIHTSGVTLPRIARRANRNLMIIPEKAEPKAEKFLVPVDFSQFSKNALATAVMISGKIDPPAEIICQNVYSVPTGYHYTGKTYQEFAEIMKKNAEKNYTKFVRDIKFGKTPISSVHNLDKDDDLTSDIIDFGNKVNPSWIFIGAKGRSATAALFIGSFAEKLISQVTQTPIFIVREKGKRSGFLDYLKGL